MSKILIFDANAGSGQQIRAEINQHMRDHGLPELAIPNTISEEMLFRLLSQIENPLVLIAALTESVPYAGVALHRRNQVIERLESSRIPFEVIDQTILTPAVLSALGA